MMNTSLARAIALAAFAAVPGLVEGALTNGGFDDNGGSLDGWTVVDGTVVVFAATWNAEASRGQIAGPQAGTHFAIGSGDGVGAYIYQSFATTPGTTYELSFHAARPQTNNSNFDLYVDVFDGGGDPGGLGSDGDLLDVGIGDGDVTTGGTWVPFTYQFTAASATSTLRILDDGTISVDPAIDSVAVTEVLNPLPTADFAASMTSGLAPLTVDFTDASTGSPTSWSWDFGDTGTSTDQNPSHTYTTAGTYTVTLTATNANGSDDEVKMDYIAVIEVPSGPTQVINGGFDDNAGSLDGWSLVNVSEGTWNAEASRGQIAGPQAGTHFAIGFGDGAGAYIYQSIATTAGTTYELSFHAARPQTNNSNFALEVDVYDGIGDPGGLGSDGGLLDVSIVNGDVTSGGAWVEFTYQFTAASAVTTLRFLDPGTFEVDPAVDSVTVVEVSSPALKISSNAGTLSFEWNSSSGKQYDLVSSEDLTTPVSTWPVYDDGTNPPYENIPADLSGTNTLIVPRPADAVRFFAVVERSLDPVTLLKESFDGVTPPALPATGDPATSWQAGSDGVAGTEWNTGVPSSTAVSVEPDGAASAPNCAGTGVGETYSADLGIWLRTPELALDSYAGYSNVTLGCQRYRDIQPGDTASIRIVKSDGTLISEVEAPSSGTDTGWQPYSKVLTPAAYPDAFLPENNPVRIEFLFTSDDLALSYAGFYIDDVVVTAN